MSPALARPDVDPCSGPGVRGRRTRSNGSQTWPTSPGATPWPERKRRHAPDRIAKPSPHRPAVPRKSRVQHRLVRLDPSPAGPTRRDDQPHRDRGRIPAPLPRDLRRESTLPVQRAEHLVDVGDVGLQLDDEDRPSRRVPGEDVDDPALSVDRERHLRREDPGRQLVPEPFRDRLVKRRVSRVDQPVEVAGTPPGLKFDPDLECGADRAHGIDRQWSDVATLDSRDGRLRDASDGSQVALAPSPALPNHPDHGPEPLIIHRERV